MVDGAPAKVTLEDLKRDYSGQAYIQKRMKEVAEDRKTAQSEAAALHAERQQLAQLVQRAKQGGLTPPTPPDDSLIQSDPIGFIEQQNAYEKRKAEYERTVSELTAQEQKQAEAQQRAYQQFLAQQAEALVQFIPEFGDPEKGTKLKDDLRRTGSDYGFSDEEITSIADARMVRVLNDAKKWRELQSGKKKAVVKAKDARPVVKPGAKKSVDPQAAKRRKQREQLRRFGRIEDAASLLLE